MSRIDNDFYWPISLKEFLNLGEEFNRGFFNLVNSSDYETKNVLLCIYGPLYNEFTAVTKNLLIINSRQKVSYCNLIHNEKSRIFNNLLQKQFYFPSIVNTLCGGLKESFIKNNLRKLKSSVLKKFPRGCSLTSINLENDIVCIHTGDLISKHSKISNEKIYFVPLIEWFRPIKDNFFYLNQRKISENVDEVLNLMIKTLKKFSVEHSIALDYLQIFVNKLLLNTNKYIGDIIEKKKFVKKLWTGSGGAVTTRILRLTTLINKGYVVGHDHSHGQGMFKNKINSLLELPFLSEFVTRTESHKKSLLSEMRKTYINYKNIKIRLMDDGKKIKIRKIQKKQRKTVLLVSTPYNIDTSFLDPLPFPSLMLDWELRLFKYLEKKGFTPVYKPHPESKINTEQLFIKNGYHVSNKRFEEIFSDFSLLIFGSPNQTSFFNSLKTDIPILIIDLGFKKWHPQALKILKKRVGYIKTKFNQNNKVILDWKGLKRELNKSEGLKDNEFAKTFFYPSLI